MTKIPARHVADVLSAIDVAMAYTGCAGAAPQYDVWEGLATARAIVRAYLVVPLDDLSIAVESPASAPAPSPTPRLDEVSA